MIVDIERQFDQVCLLLAFMSLSRARGQEASLYILLLTSGQHCTFIAS